MAWCQEHGLGYPATVLWFFLYVCWLDGESSEVKNAFLDPAKPVYRKFVVAVRQVRILRQRLGNGECFEAD